MVEKINKSGWYCGARNAYTPGFEIIQIIRTEKKRMQTFLHHQPPTPPHLLSPSQMFLRRGIVNVSGASERLTSQVRVKGVGVGVRRAEKKKKSWPWRETL